MADILLIEDDGAFAHMIRTALEKRGYQVTLARDGRSGLDEYQRKRPDLTICDINIPVIDGLQVISTINFQDCDARIIAISGGSDVISAEDSLMHAQTLEVNAVFEKPFALSEFLDTVETLTFRN